MTVINLSLRWTSDKKLYESFKKSPDSLIYVEKNFQAEGDAFFSMDFTIGDVYYNPKDNLDYRTPADGLSLPPQTSFVISTEQEIALPYNVYGLVVGKGEFIFRGVIISSGKIKPGFNQKLRVGIFNSSNQPIFLKKSNPFCSGIFFSTDQTADSAKNTFLPVQEPKEFFPWYFRPKSFFVYATPFVPWLAFIVSIIALFIKGSRP